MPSQWRMWALALICLACIPRSVSAASEPLYRRLKLSLGYHYSSGTYGTSNTTETMYVPLTATLDIGRWSLQGTVPYLRISGPPGVVQGPNGPVQTTSGQADGLGDILARGSYFLPPVRDWMPFIELIGRVKFPTASRSAGLGTGEFDAGFETEFSWIVRRFTPFFDVGYRYLGSSPSLALDNVFLGSVGATYWVLDPLNVGLLLDYRQAASASTGERLELVPFGTWTIDKHWSADVYVTAGLASGSPDVGTGVQIGYALSGFSLFAERP
ncbi:MAG TPA: hypothetical protein VMW56_16220 [Candidatus Margulisiibacteriota bacterium]|nr:hypothetical protein [Candidatus Margulisiibacteriota bacterium]